MKHGYASKERGAGFVTKKAVLAAELAGVNP